MSIINTEIDKTTLFHRLWKVYGRGDNYDIEKGRVTLCSYIRRGIGGFAMAWIIVFLVVAALLPLMEVIGTLIQGTLTGDWTPFIYIPDGPSWTYLSGTTVVIVSAIEVVGAFIGGLIWVAEVYDAYRKAHPSLEKQPKPKKKPGLIVSYYRAWKQKYCPIVHFKKEETSDV